MLTLEQFKKEYREKEQLEGTRQHNADGVIAPRGPMTDAELEQMYQQLKDNSKTGLYHSGPIMENSPVLTLKETGK